MKTLTGYSDKISVRPGDTIRFFVSSEDGTPYRARLIRSIHGDINPDGPGYKEEAIAAAFDGDYPGEHQIIHAGSHGFVAAPTSLAGLKSFTVQLLAWPSTPAKGEQILISHWEGQRGFQLLIDATGAAAIRVGDGSAVKLVSTGERLQDRRWYRIAASFDAGSGRLSISQFSAPTANDNGRQAAASGEGAFASAGAAWLSFAAARPSEQVPASGHYNGKLEAPRIFGAALSETEIAETVDANAALKRGDLLGAWDFSRDIESETLRDLSPHGLHGQTVHMPMRAVTGYAWTGEEMNWNNRPDHYGAIHFHDDDVYDAGWREGFSWQVPEGIRSGVYCAHLVNGSDEEFIPFAVRAPRGKPASKLAYLMPTASYMAYGNEHMVTDAPPAELMMTKALVVYPHEMFLAAHREYGGSHYDMHSDFSGVAYSSRLRPLLNMRPKVQGFLGGPGSGLWQFNADTHITDFLEAGGLDFDVITDEDLHYEGLDALEGYRCVITGSHPEYYSQQMLNAVDQFKESGGRVIYMGGNGFYWRVAYHKTKPGILELRRAEDGIRSWLSAPGEYYHSFTGEYGGLWQRNGRPSQTVIGVGMTAQGFDRSSYYRRTAQSRDPRAAFIFQGVDEEIIGDFGLCGGGAAGLEIDRADFALGTPVHALVLASSEKHSDAYLMVPEDVYAMTLSIGGESNPLVHADMVFFETAGGGAVFSTSSIAWSGSLSHNGYDNNVARITRNVIERFIDDAPFVLE